MKARHPVRSRRGTLRRVLAGLLLVAGAALVLVALPRCSSQHALLLTVTADSLVDTLDLKVKDLGSSQVVLERLAEKVDPANSNRDISKPGQGLKLAIEFETSGTYLIYMQGVGPNGKQFFIRDFQVNGVQEAEAHLIALPSSKDGDGDGFPDCAATELCKEPPCRWFDCDDKDPDINPMAKERCGDSKDNDCSAGCGGTGGDQVCVDADGDGEDSLTDCDDNDPCRSTKIHEGATLCNQPDGYFVVPGTCKKELKAPFCDDGIDQDCNGQDAHCVTDEDCDGFSPPTDDCNDKDPKINKAATEACDGIDNNCNGVTDEGCVPCDVDGDGHALSTVTDPACKVPHDDTDDFDAGVHPLTTQKTSGAEGGNTLGGLRGWCRPTAGMEKDGKAPKDIDHDGDKLPASADGCPPPNCDVDGDGFPGDQCSPPASTRDCDDADPQSFPGAPDRCGDSKAQNCVADAACTTDNDKDGYSAPADCNDADPKVHPWALELCNAIDDDCDELIDETNPDPAGKPMPVAAKSCNDDNNGFCGDCKWGPAADCKNGHLLSGVCACSPIALTTKRDPANNRVACAGEDLGAKASPRCIGARQPESMERCEAGDFDCNGADMKPGEPFVDKGHTCSVTAGECVLGHVIDCDLSKQVENLALVKAIDASFNPSWICDGKLPVPEKCNGRDDDCKGGPGVTEVDADGDLYLACSGDCSNLIPGLKGCGDCKPGNDLAYPGAAELCNGQDENCNSQIDDNPTDCSGLTCCPVVNSCKNLMTDAAHCGGCNKPCPKGTTDSCVNGQCVCSGSGKVCDPGQSCVGGACKCDAAACPGCCEGNNCHFAGLTDAARCGAAAATCKSCDDAKECTNDVCVAGACQNNNRAAGTACASGAGKCRGDQCCQGCWDGSTCQAGTSLAQCGNTGNLCAACNPTGGCDNPSCATGSCQHAPQPNTTACSGGLCYGGACCTTCWDGAACINPPTPAKCGDNGANCAPCSTTNPCETATCPGGACTIAPRTNGSTCPGGICQAGNCCTGCMSGTNCVVGTASNACGTGGEVCDACGTNETCSGGNCSCPSGKCTSAGACVDGTANDACGSSGTCQNCTTNGRVCQSQACTCLGCMYSGTCYVNTANHCGTGGGSCTTCTAGECKVPTCPSGSCSTSNATDLTPCTGGRCVGGQCCTTCVTSGGSCHANGTADNACGAGGIACADCVNPAKCNSTTHTCQ